MNGEAVTEREEGWLQVKIPLPYSLKWVNAYLLPEEDGWTLVDPGLRTPETEAVWEEVLDGRGIRPERIRRIVLTHHHPDHYGLAGWFQERTGAPVWMSEAARQAADRMWAEGETYTEKLMDAFRRHGLPDGLAHDMRGHLLGFRRRVSPRPAEVEPLRAGSVFRMGGRYWELIGGEGHAPGQISFYDRHGRTLICGDMVLPDISPNIGWMPGGDPDPLASFLMTMSRLSELEADMAYPGHREPFTGFRERALALIDHHERRLAKVTDLFESGEAASFEIGERLFGSHLRTNAHHLRFALAETIAHLVYLERRGRLSRTEESPDGLIRYRHPPG